MTSPEPSTSGPHAPDWDPVRIRADLSVRDPRWRDIDVLATTGSTNSDLADALRRGAAREWSVVAAAEQTAGRGRMGRQWRSDPGTTVSFSVALAPPVSRAAFLPLLTGLAISRTVAELAAPAGVSAVLKWPNDVLIGQDKVCGILAESVADALVPDGVVVVGCGINVSGDGPEPLVAGATSLAQHGLVAGRDEVLVAALTTLGAVYDRWAQAGFDPVAAGLLAEYRGVCDTLGRAVRVLFPDGAEVQGTAVDVDDDGHLVVRTDAGRRTVTAGDVLHVRGRVT